MVSKAFDYSDCTAISNAKPFSYAAPHKEVPAGCSIEAGISCDRVIFPNVGFLLSGTDNDCASTHTLANIVVCLSEKVHSNTWSEESAETLPCSSDKLKVDRSRGEVVASTNVRNFS